MKKLLIIFSFILGIISFSGCLEEEEPELDPCSDADWGMVERNGEKICFPTATAFYYNANTSYSKFEVQMGNFGVVGAISLSAQFDVPTAGIELNKAYALSGGDFYGVEDLVSGEMTILTYEPIDNGSYCASGTFNMITKNPNSGSQTTLTNGKFLFQQGITNCNPF